MKIKLGTALAKAGKAFKKNSPLLLTVGGVIGLGGTAVLSYKAAKKVEVIVEDIEERREVDEKIAKMEESLEVTQRFAVNSAEIQAMETEIVQLKENHIPVKRVDMVKDIAGAVALPTVTGIASVTCIALSYYIQNNRIVNLATALATSVAERKYYEAKYRKENGDEKANEFYTPTEKFEEQVEVDGKKKKVKGTEKKDLDSIHGEWFDKSSEYTSDDHHYNMSYIKAAESKVDEKLFRRGYITMNELFDELGFQRTKQGALLGWSTSSGFNVYTEIVNVTDRRTGELRPEIYVKWTQPTFIYDNIEYEGRYSLGN